MKTRIDAETIAALSSYRQACQLAWEMRHRPRMTLRQLSEEAGLYPSHATDYFSDNESRRELPARRIADVERVLGNTAISQWMAHQSGLPLALSQQGLA